MGSKHTVSSRGGNTSASGVLKVRRAHHAGSWYSDDHEELNHMLTSFLHSAHQELNNNHNNSSIPRAIISPHAGYSYSGPTAAYAYAALHEALTAHAHAHTHTHAQSPSTMTIVVLHPSHHVYLDNACAVSSVDVLDTPLGQLQVAHALREELLSSGHFTTMNRAVDEAEHSGEMQYPFIAKIVRDVIPTASASATAGDGNFLGHGVVSVLPIMVGSLRTDKEQFFGQVLAPVLARPDIFCVVSSDFCHWGSRFGYSPWDNKCIEIHEYIEWLDRGGMDHIALQDPGAFATYLKKYRNTICGRNPIGVWLNSVLTNKENGMEQLDVKFVRYAQSSKVRDVRESSVSYASGVARFVA